MWCADAAPSSRLRGKVEVKGASRRAQGALRRICATRANSDLADRRSIGSRLWRAQRQAPTGVGALRT
jgi:hypothetical protein